MKGLVRNISLISLTILCGGCHLFYNPQPVLNIDAETETLSHQTKKINPKVVKLALRAYNKAQIDGYDSKHLLTIIDYSKPSTEQRLWVVDLNSHKVLYQESVAHGLESGNVYA